MEEVGGASRGPDLTPGRWTMLARSTALLLLGSTSSFSGSFLSGTLAVSEAVFSSLYKKAAAVHVKSAQLTFLCWDSSSGAVGPLTDDRASHTASNIAVGCKLFTSIRECWTSSCGDLLHCALPVPGQLRESNTRFLFSFTQDILYWHPLNKGDALKPVTCDSLPHVVSIKCGNQCNFFPGYDFRCKRTTTISAPPLGRCSIPLTIFSH